MNDPRVPAPESVLVVRASSIGDVVLTEPVVAALRETLPGARIGFVVAERYVDLVRGNSSISTLHLVRGNSANGLRALAAEVRSASYEVVVDLHRNMRSVFLSRVSGARVVTAYRKRSLADTVRVRFLRRPFRARRLLVERYLEALAPLGVASEAYRAPRYHPAPDDRERAEGRLRALGLEGRGYAVVAPGAKWATKRWPADRFASVAARVEGELGLPVILLGSHSERGICREVAGGGRRAERVLAGEASLGESAAIISLAALFIGNDSGPTHIAAAGGVPTVAIFGPTDPGQFSFGDVGLVYADLPCSACSFFGTHACRLRHWRCMTSVSVEDVVAAAGAVVGRSA